METTFSTICLDLKFVLISYNAWIRPRGLVGAVEKQRSITTEGKNKIKEVIRGGLRWMDVEVDIAEHIHDQSGKKFEVPEAILYISE